MSVLLRRSTARLFSTSSMTSSRERTASAPALTLGGEGMVNCTDPTASGVPYGDCACPPTRQRELRLEVAPTLSPLGAPATAVAGGPERAGRSRQARRSRLR